MNRIFVLITISLVIPTILSAQSTPEKGGWYFQPSAFYFDLGSASTNTNIGGAEVPGENVSFTNSLVPGVGVGYHINSKISIYTVIAYPPTTEAEGTNNLDGLTAADVQYAPFALTGNYHFQLGNFQPFIGGGIAFAAILDVKDRDVSDVEADNSFGFVLRGGFDYMLNDTWGVSFAANKLYVGTDITGSAPVAPDVLAPAEVEATLNPWVFSLGATYRL